MSTATQARTTKSNAKATARSASATAKSAGRTAKRTTRSTGTGVTTHTRRVLGAFQAEANAVASQPTRPLFFTLGVVDRATAGVRALPSTLVSTPTRTRDRVVNVFATAGDLAERAQRGYTEVAKDGEKLVAAVRRQDSTQRAVKLADRAQTRAAGSVKAAEQALEAGTEAAVEAVSKLG
jgi:hypothetical protein